MGNNARDRLPGTVPFDSHEQLVARDFGVVVPVYAVHYGPHGLVRYFSVRLLRKEHIPDDIGHLLELEVAASVDIVLLEHLVNRLANLGISSLRVHRSIIYQFTNISYFNQRELTYCDAVCMNYPTASLLQ